MANRGRPSTFSSKKIIAKALEVGDAGSRYLNLQLVEEGYFQIELIQSGHRGRPVHKFVLTGKGRGLLALARNWGKKLENLKNFFQADPLNVEDFSQAA